MRVVVYELNEVPWRIVDDHVRRCPGGAFARLVATGTCRTTRASGPLHPWRTWPTMHRGTQAHGVRFLGQAPPTGGPPPLWEVALAAGRRIGVFGALPSWPARPLHGRGFHVPDLFAADARCEPAALTPFQALCLDQAAVIRNRVGRPPWRSALRGLPALARLGVRPWTAATVACHLARAAHDPYLRYRLPGEATRLAFDVFAAAWRRHRPHYASFFANHLAFVMHRFWRAAYPGDFAIHVDDFVAGSGGDDRYANAVPEAMVLADAHLAALLAAADRDPSLVVVVAGSMGQGPGAGRRNLGALTLEAPGALLVALGIQAPWARGRAMEPDVPLRFEDAGCAARAGAAVASVTDTAGDALFEVERAGVDLLIRLTQRHSALVDRLAVLPGGVRTPLNHLGIRHFATDTPVTGVHTPDGALAFYGARIRPDPTRTTVALTRYAPTLLGLLGVAPSPWMTDPGLHEEICTR